MNKLLSLLILLVFSCPVFADDYAEITAMILSSGTGTVGAPVTITVTANGTDLQYKFWANTKGFCHKPCQNPHSSHWIVLQEWSSANTCTWVPDTSGSYTLVVYVSDDPDASCRNVIGAGFTVEDLPAVLVGVDVSGDYLIDIQDQGASYQFPVTLSQTGNMFFGSFATPDYSGTISGTIVDPATATFQIVFETPCMGVFSGTATIANDGDELTGESCIGPYEATILFTRQ